MAKKSTVARREYIVFEIPPHEFASLTAYNRSAGWVRIEVEKRSSGGDFHSIGDLEIRRERGEASTQWEAVNNAVEYKLTAELVNPSSGSTTPLEHRLRTPYPSQRLIDAATVFSAGRTPEVYIAISLTHRNPLAKPKKKAGKVKAMRANEPAVRKKRLKSK